MRSAAALEAVGDGTRTPDDAFSHFEITGPQLLLQLAAGVATVLAALLAMRSCGLLSRAILPALVVAPLALFAATLALRVPLRELVRSLGPRERAALAFVHLALFLFPMFDAATRFLVLGLTAVQLPMILLLVEPRQYTRLQAVQLVVVLVAGLTDRHDDLFSAVATTGFLAALVVQSFALRVVAVANSYEVTPRAGLLAAAVAVGPTIVLLAGITVASLVALDGRTFAARPTYGFGSPAPRGGAAMTGASGVGGGMGRLATALVVATIALVAAAYLLDKLRDALEKRRRRREMDLDYDVATFEPDVAAPAAPPAAPPASGPRRRLVASYLRLLDRIGRQRGPRAPGETAGEYEHAVTEHAAWRAAAAEALADLRAPFERARYGAEEPAAADLAAYERRAADLATLLASLPADPRDAAPPPSPVPPPRRPAP